MALRIVAEIARVPGHAEEDREHRGMRIEDCCAILDNEQMRGRRATAPPLLSRNVAQVHARATRAQIICDHSVKLFRSAVARTRRATVRLVIAAP